jgi:hypothetical protein
MSTAGLYLLNLVLALSVLVNLMGCIWWFVAEIEGLDNSWAAAVGEWGGTYRGLRNTALPPLPLLLLRPPQPAMALPAARRLLTCHATYLCWRRWILPTCPYPPTPPCRAERGAAGGV